MGKSKRKHSKRTNYEPFDEESYQKSWHKRSEVDTTNCKTNEKNVNKNRVEDISECIESLTEGIHKVHINKTENKELDSYKGKECIANKDLFDLQSTEFVNQKKMHGKLETSESVDKVIIEIEEDLFKLSPSSTSLACCVDEDFKMESRIGRQFRDNFDDIDKLLEENLKRGSVGVVNRHGQNAFYLITKKCSSSKSKMGTIVEAFKNLLIKMKEMGLTQLAIAKIDFELQGHNWSDIETNMTNVFAGSGIHITVCVPSKEDRQSEDSFSSNKKTRNEYELSAFANELSDQTDKDSNNDTINKKKKNMNKFKKSRHEDNIDLNNSTKFDSNKSKKKLSTNNPCDVSVDRKSFQSTDSHTSQELRKERCAKKPLNNKNSIKNKNNSFDNGCPAVSKDANFLKEIDQDLFKLSEEYSLAHCVAQDLQMGAGIAVDFKQRFGGVGKLVDQKLKVGSVGFVQNRNRNVFYLVTKKFSNGKPTMKSLEVALRSLLRMMKDRNLMKLGIPKIGCGLDGLDWDDVKLLIVDIFSESNIDITVCIPSKFLDHTAPPPLKVFITRNNLWEMESETTIIMPIDLKQVNNQNWSDSIIDEVNSRYPFKENLLKDIRKSTLSPGAIKEYCVNDERLVCVFFLQTKYYSSLEIALKEILRSSKNYLYLAIQSGPVVDNFQHISWIVLILRSISNAHQSQLWLCGDTKQTDKEVMYDEYCRNIRYSMDYTTSRVISKSYNVPHSFGEKGHNQNFRRTLGDGKLFKQTHSNNSFNTSGCLSNT